MVLTASLQSGHSAFSFAHRRMQPRQNWCLQGIVYAMSICASQRMGHFYTTSMVMILLLERAGDSRARGAAPPR